MKKFLFVGGTNGNTGPANVNKGIVANLSDAFCIADSINKVKKYIDAFIGVVRCKVIVVSGMSKVGVYAIKLQHWDYHRMVFVNLQRFGTIKQKEINCSRNFYC